MHSGKKQKSKAKPHGFKSSYRPSELFGIHANIHYFDNLKKLMDAHKTKTESILMRNRAVEAFNRKSYQHELAGIEKHLSNSITPYTNYEMKKRKEEIEKLLQDKI